MTKGFIFDLDGTVYLEDKLIDGASEAIKQLRNRGDKVVFLTNKSIETVDSYVQKLNRFGIAADADNVINSNFLVARYLKTKLNDNEEVMVIGEEPLFDELTDAGIKISSRSDVSYVVLGWDRQFNYDKLNRAYQSWRNGAKVIATNPDRTCPIKGGGQIPDCGAMIGALEGATGEKITSILGKPSSLAGNFIMNDILELAPKNCYMIGDRLETDIKMGLACGMNAVLVLTGITTEDMIANTPYKPTYVLDSIRDVPNI